MIPAVTIYGNAENRYIIVLSTSAPPTVWYFDNIDDIAKLAEQALAEGENQ